MKLKYIIDKKYDLSFCHKQKDKKIALNIYKTSLPVLLEAKDLYQKSWDKINDDFSDYIKDLTNHDWYYDKYECVISAIHSGLSNWGHEPKIVRGFSENHHVQRRITAFELIISHCFEIYKSNFLDLQLNDKQVWACAEATALFLTSFTSQSKRFWPWDFTEYYMDNTYPELIEYQREMKKIFLKRKDFSSYFLQALNKATEIKKL